VVDETMISDLNKDFVTITVTDNNWNWWKVLIDFDAGKEITTIKLKSYYGTSEWKAGHQGSTFTQSTVIDLFNSSNFDTKTGIGGMYQNASVGSDNRLVTNLADDSLQKKLALISFRLLFDGV
jgi:hypothetical protein